MIRSPLILFIFIAVIIAFILKTYDTPNEGDIITEAYGFLFDIILFGIILTIYNKIIERGNRIRSYYEQFEDYFKWGEVEGILRKEGIIKRLNKLNAELPSMSKANLNGVDLFVANLRGASFHETSLQKANLVGADLTNAFLWESNLKKAKLDFANLEHAQLDIANLEQASLLTANLKNAGLDKANLTGADLEGANLRGAHIWDTNFTNAKNLSWKQLKGARSNHLTILPAYLKDSKPDSFKGKFDDEI